jgi:DNA-binding MarR family transcriptional regulator
MSSDLSASELRVAVGRIARRMRQLYATHDDVVSFTETAVLSRLNSDGPSSPSVLAGREQVTAQAITQVVNLLERREFITRRPDPNDGRRTIVAISAAGEAVLADREQVVHRRLLHALDRLSSAERRRLAETIPLLERIAEAL